jgi:hypothetical protein
MVWETFSRVLDARKFFEKFLSKLPDGGFFGTPCRSKNFQIKKSENPSKNVTKNSKNSSKIQKSLKIRFPITIIQKIQNSHYHNSKDTKIVIF